MNIPGIFKIEYLEFDKVNLPYISSNSTVNLSNYISESPISLDFIPETAGLSVKEKQSKSNSFDLVEINLKIEGHDQDKISILNDLRDKPHIYRITDKSGNKYLIGFNYKPFALFSYNFKNDPTAKGGRVIMAKISWQTNIFPVFLT